MAEKKSAVEYNIVGMSMNEMEDALVDAFVGAIENGYPPDAHMCWGPPGIGKTYKLYAAANKAAHRLKLREIEVKCLMLSCMEPTDIVGVPFRHETSPYTQYLPLNWAWRASKEYEEQEGEGAPMVLFFDDFPVAHEQTQAAGHKLFHEKMAGDLHIRDNVFLVAAGNRPEDNAAAQDMPTAMASRFRHIYCVLRADEWVDWAQNQGMIHPLVTAFIHGHKSCLHEFDPASSEKAFPCPRTWEMVSNALHEVKGDFEHSRFKRTTIGIVGHGMAQQFFTVLDHMKHAVPVEEVLENPKKARIPSMENIDALYATMMNLIYEVRQTPKHWEPVMQYISRDKMVPEIGAVLFKSVNNVVISHQNLHEKALDSPVYTDLLERYVDIVGV